MTGTLRYSPKLLGASLSKFWLVIDCEPEIGKYYRHLFHLMTYRCYKLQRPAWESHITVVRDEEPLNKQYWKKYDGQSIDFSISPEVGTNGDYFWFPVECEFAFNIREELGLIKMPEFPFHISIGHGVY